MTQKRKYACNNALPYAFMGLSLIFLSRCTQKHEASLDAIYYYMHEQSLSGSGIVYVYEPVVDAILPTEYWHHWYSPNFRGNFLRSKLYDETGEIRQTVMERVTPDAVYLVSLDLWVPTDTGTMKISTTVNKNEVFFPGIPDTTRVATSQVEYWQTEGDSIRIILTKQRRFLRRLNYPFEGEDAPALEIEVVEVLETEQDGFTESTWKGSEIYLQDIGLVYFKKEINDAIQLEYHLVDRMPFDAFRAGRR